MLLEIIAQVSHARNIVEQLNSTPQRGTMLLLSDLFGFSADGSGELHQRYNQRDVPDRGGRSARPYAYQ